MPYLPSHKTLFIHIPKCAGKSIEQCLSRLGPLRFREEPVNPEWELISECSRGRLKTMHFSYLDHLNLLKLDPKEILSFAVVRNPYAKLVSHYAFMHKNYLRGGQTVRALDHYRLAGNAEDFRTFVKALSDRRELCNKFSHLDYIRDQQGGIGINKLLRFEHLNEDFAQIKYTIARRNKWCSTFHPAFLLKKLPFINAMPAYNYRASYDQKTADLVFEIFRPEFELFKYSRLHLT